MSSYNKRLFKGRNIFEENELHKPSSSDDLDNQCLFFYDDSNYKPEYLEMPIKIEGDLRHRPHKREDVKHQSSNESSQHMDHTDIFNETTQKYGQAQYSKQNLKDEYEELLYPHGRMDLIDSLLMQGMDAQSQMPIQMNHFMLEPGSVKEEEVVGIYPRFQDQENGQKGLLEEKKKDILNLMNTFRSFGHAINVAMNFHKLTKKDSLNKAHSNVFNVLTKETRKLQAQMDNQYARFTAMVDFEAKDARDSKERQKFLCLGLSKELVSTAAGHEPLLKLQDVEKMGQRK